MFARIKRKLRLWLLADESSANTTTTAITNDNVDMIKLAPYIKSDSVFVNGNAYHGNSKDNNQSHHHGIINSDGVRFTVYRANGGTIIETTSVSAAGINSLGIQLSSLTYPNQPSATPCNLYVVSNDDDLGSAINKIITLHNLTK